MKCKESKEADGKHPTIVVMIARLQDVVDDPAVAPAIREKAKMKILRAKEYLKNGDPDEES